MSIPRRSYTLAVTRPGNLTSLPAAKIAVFQACELDLTLRLPTGETFDGATQVRLEIHTSQTSDPDDVLTTFVVDSPTGNTLTLGLTGDYLNHTFTGPLGEFWLNIVAHWSDTDRIEPLRCANLFLHRHNASLSTPPPPAGLIPYVRFDIAQTGLTTQQKTQARTNISAASESQANSIQTELTNLASDTTNALAGKADLGNDGKVPANQLPAATGGTWGSITGTLSDQTDLQAALDAKAPTSTTVTLTGAQTLTNKNINIGYGYLLIGESYQIKSDGTQIFAYAPANGNSYVALVGASGGVAMASFVPCGWTSGGATGNLDVPLWRDGPGILAQKNGANAQKSRIYGNETGSKYLQLEHDGTNAILGASSGLVKIPGQAVEASTVGTLPLASASLFASYGVIDALSPTVGSAVASGGSAKAVVRSNGAVWKVTEVL